MEVVITVRQKRKRIEDTIIKVFLDHLKTINLNPIVDESVRDKPDLVFELNGSRVGCELTTLTRKDFEEWVRHRGEIGKPRVLRVSNEPELWLKERIEEKDLKRDEYVTLRDLDALWLILHVGVFPAFGNDEVTLRRLKWLCQETEHRFEEIWFIGERNYVERIWLTGQPKIEEEPPRPKHGQIIHRAVTVNGSKGGVVVADLGDDEPEDCNDLQSTFLRAAYFNKISVVEGMLRSGVDVNYRDKRGNTALRYAAGQGNKEIVEFLIENGARVNSECDNKRLSLPDLCDSRGYTEIAEIIRAQIDKDNGIK